MAGPISGLLRPSAIVLELESTDRASAIREVADQLQGNPTITDFAGFYRDLLAREELDSTCLGNEVALPHARTEHVHEMVLAVGRSRSGIFYKTDQQTVRLFFVLGTPADQPLDYLLVVRDLCKVMKNPAHRGALLAANTAEEFILAWQKADASPAAKLSGQ